MDEEKSSSLTEFWDNHSPKIWPILMVALVAWVGTEIFFKKETVPSSVGIVGQQASETSREDESLPVVIPASKKECLIKGNISASGEKIYHEPGDRFYDVTQIDSYKGEQWFCDETEAEAAGWRKSKV